MVMMLALLMAPPFQRCLPAEEKADDKPDRRCAAGDEHDFVVAHRFFFLAWRAALRLAFAARRLFAMAMFARTAASLAGDMLAPPRAPR